MTPQLSLLLSGILVVVVILAWLRLSMGRQHATAPPPRSARYAEALALLLLASLVLVVAAVTPQDGGMLLRLDEVPPPMAKNLLVLFLAVQVVILCGAGAAFFGATRLGIVVCAGALMAYGIAINNPDMFGVAAPRAQGYTSVQLRLALGGVNIPHGAEMWVNGVPLGELPVEMPLDTFLDKVPREPKEGKAERHVWVKDPSLYGMADKFEHLIPFELTLPRNYARSGEAAPKYFATIVYAGEKALGTGGGGGGGSGGGYSYNSSRTLEVQFPARNLRLQALLNQARLMDYKVTPEWLEALETYDVDAPMALRTLAQTNKSLDANHSAQADAWRPEETGFLEVLQAWAAWRYKLETVHDADSAWTAFERVMAAADAKGIYVTTSEAGAAVEWLAPQLDQQRLVDCALRTLDAYESYGYRGWREFDAIQFGVVTRPGGASTGSDGTATFGNTGRGGTEMFPPHAAAVAHAIWLQHQRDLNTSNGDSPIVRELAPALLRRAYGTHSTAPFFPAAVELGGPAVEQYLLRHEWRSPPEAFPDTSSDRLSVHSLSLNKWTYAVSQLDTPRAAEVRGHHWDVFLELAGDLTTSDNADLRDDLRFLFHDLDAGKQCLAWKFWPEFLERVQDRQDRVKQAFTYLVDMEPLSTVDLYAEAWRKCMQTDKDGGYGDTFVPLRALPEAKLKEVYAALLKVAEELSLPPAQQSWIKSALYPVDYITESVRALLLQPETKYVEQVRAWLKQGNPAHPVVQQLAKSSKAEWRALSLVAIEACPTPEHRTLLKVLLKDPEASVRNEAEKVRMALEQLAATPPATFASGASTFLEEAAAQYIPEDVLMRGGAGM